MWKHGRTRRGSCRARAAGILECEVKSFSKIDATATTSPAPLVTWLGERSCSLFLVHVTAFHLADWLVAFVTPHRSLVYALLTRANGLPLALGLGMLLFHAVERRFARGLITADLFWPPLSGMAWPGRRSPLG